MKTGALTIFFAPCLPIIVFVTTLHLSNEIDLLVLDGKEVSNSLLHGADNIELENWPHQLVFWWRKPSVYPVMKSGFIFLYH